MRIHIIGGPGSGKSYLARKLSENLNLPLINLDELYYNSSNHKKECEKKILEKDWITEGHWTDWSEECFKKADKIIFLDVSRKKRDFNLTKRWLKRILGLEKGRKPGIKGFIEMIKINHKWDEAEAKNLVSKHLKKVQTFTKADKAIKKLAQ